MNVDEKKERIDAVECWWHSIDFGDDVVSVGEKSMETLSSEFRSLRLPPLSGKSVLDIGAWDGYFSFRCEKLGAGRVVALDYFVWSIDLPKVRAYCGSCREKGAVPQHYDSLPGIWRPDELPGKQGFDTAKEILGSAVEPVVGDFMQMDLEELGQFDIVLFLGIIYHMKDPFGALRRLASVTKELALIETEAVFMPGLEGNGLWEFYESNELFGDITNWWVPSEKGLVGMCRAAGFSKVTVLSPDLKSEEGRRDLTPWQKETLAAGKPMHYRLVVQARK